VRLADVEWLTAERKLGKTERLGQFARSVISDFSPAISHLSSAIFDDPVRRKRPAPADLRGGQGSADLLI
jgi:hypothetical protein